jgi:transcriptional regulator with XRE-family HTH domain
MGYSSSDARVLRLFGEAVRKHRRVIGLSQEKLAELADLHRTYIADIERCTRNIGLINITRLAEALRICPGKLLDTLPRRPPVWLSARLGLSPFLQPPLSRTPSGREKSFVAAYCKQERPNKIPHLANYRRKIIT